MMKISEVQVVNKDPYQHPLRIPMPFGPLDLRMGTSSKKENCATCGQRVEICPGHFGFIRLALPCYHIGFMKQIQNVLTLICKTCSRSLFEERERLNWLKRLRNAKDVTKRNEIVKRILKAAKTQTFCPHCGARNGGKCPFPFLS
jgi:DNA-directed RNA polymerase III subunit RPC1